jgi:hypothetical protein
MIRDDVADLRRYLIELRVLLFDQAGAGSGGGGKVIDSPAPWNTPVGELLTDIHAGARRLARTWAEATGRPMPALGAVDAGTMKALDFVGTEVERQRAVKGFEEWVQSSERYVAGWARQCREQLGILRQSDEPWSRVPLRCPNPGCGAPLYLPPGWATMPAPGVSCLAEVDEHGGRPTWTYQEWSSVAPVVLALGQAV